MYNLISDSEIVHNNNNYCIITPLLVTCVIVVSPIYMGFPELAPISINLIFI